MPAPDSNTNDSPATLVARSAFGGMLMGLANLVPGLSGGTMLLAAGIYPRFISAVAEVSTFRFRLRSLLVLATVITAAFIAIIAGAGLIGGLVVHQRWIMYALFIGLTLGGAPILWRMLRPLDTTVIISACVGFGLMIPLAILDPGSAAASSAGRAYAMLLIAGIAGGAAMILPGVSGGYLLLILGQYVVILTAIDDARAAAGAGDWSLAAQSLHVIIPVGVGVLIGVVGVSNIIKILLARYNRPTLGVLLGLLLGAVIGLWPFQHGIAPQIGDVIKGITLTTQPLVDAVEPEDWHTQWFTPRIWQIAVVLVLIILGFAAATAIARLGRDPEAAD